MSDRQLKKVQGYIPLNAQCYLATGQVNMLVYLSILLHRLLYLYYIYYSYYCINCSNIVKDQSSAFELAITPDMGHDGWANVVTLSNIHECSLLT